MQVGEGQREIERERERERDLCRLCCISVEPDVELKLPNWDHDLNRSQALNWLSHPDTPFSLYFSNLLISIVWSSFNDYSAGSNMLSLLINILFQFQISTPFNSKFSPPNFYLILLNFYFFIHILYLVRYCSHTFL